MFWVLILCFLYIFCPKTHPPPPQDFFYFRSLPTNNDFSHCSRAAWWVALVMCTRFGFRAFFFSRKKIKTKKALTSFFAFLKIKKKSVQNRETTNNNNKNNEIKEISIKLDF